MLERSDQDRRSDQDQLSGDEARRAVGRHVLADLSGIPAAQLQDEELLNTALRDALLAAGFQIVDQHSYKFPGDHAGVTGVALLSESHAAYHTYPEFGYVAVDVFSCGTPDPEQVIKFLVDRLQPADCRTSAHIRGHRV